MIRKPNFKLNWKYALGEIALIFIGITSAIWFNNWNEERNDRKLEKHFYGLIISDMQATSDDIREAMESGRLRIESGNNILRRLDPSHGDIFTAEKVPQAAIFRVRFEDLMSHLSDLSRDLLICKTVQIIDTRTAGFQEITSSGKLQAIQDDQLRSEIVTVYQQIEDWAESNTFFRSSGERYALHMEAAGISQQEMRSDEYIIQCIQNNQVFQASIRSQIATGYEQNVTYPYMLEYIEQFRQKIESVLKAE